jgi:hypothetical protein
MCRSAYYQLRLPDTGPDHTEYLPGERVAIYVKRSCGRCGSTLETWTRSYTSFGSPVTECPTCHAAVKLTHRNEWGVMTSSQRLVFIGAVFWTGVVWAISFGVFLPIAGVLAYALIFTDGHTPVGDDLVRTLKVAGLPLGGMGLLLFARMVVREYLASRERLNDAAYVRYLANHGFIRRT